MRNCHDGQLSVGIDQQQDEEQENGISDEDVQSLNANIVYEPLNSQYVPHLWQYVARKFSIIFVKAYNDI